jgi:putative ABC transport system permease protein
MFSDILPLFPLFLRIARPLRSRSHVVLMNDLRYATRLLRKSPLFTAAIALTIAIGIGATTAIFSVVNAVLLRPLPFGDPVRLMQVSEKNDTLRLPTFAGSVLNYLSWKERTQSFEQLGAAGFANFN